jgi:cobalt-zinc-cadmium efflux system protein
MSAQSHGDHHDHHDHDHDHAHHHDHGHDHAPKSFGAAFAVGTLLNLGLVVGQIVFGLAANSVALLADAAHNFGDVLALLLAWGAAWLGQQSPSTRRTYGWGRSSILAALINAVVLLVGAGAIAVEALHRLQDPGPVGGMTVIFVGLAGIVINGFTAYLFSHGHDDLNIRAAFLHMVSDAAVSLGVVLAAGGILLTGWLWLDPLASLLIVAAIILGTWGTLRDAVNLAMDGVPTRIAHDDVQAHLRALPDVIEVHDLHIWGLSTTQIALTAHLVRGDTGDDQAMILAAVRGLKQKFAIDHATLQVETAASAEICALRPAHVV